MEAFITDCAKTLEAHTSFKRVGGLYHWRVGCVGGSLYIKRRNPREMTMRQRVMNRVGEMLDPPRREPAVVEAQPRFDAARIAFALRK